MKKFISVLILSIILCTSAFATQNQSQLSKTAQNTTTKQPEAYWTPYMKALQKKIKRNWNPSNNKRSKRVTVIFTLDKAGQMKDLELKQSSGSIKYDSEALAAMKKAAPFEPLPKEFDGDDIDICFTFDYNVFGNVITPVTAEFLPDENNKPSVESQYYLEQTELILSDLWQPPVSFRKKKVVIFLALNKNGKIEQMKVEESSGDKKVDTSAICAIRRAEPFAQMPVNMDKSDILCTFCYKGQKASATSAKRGIFAGFFGLLSLIALAIVQ